MPGFYLIAGGLALVTALVLVRPLVAGRRDAPTRDATDAQVFRDQLAELDRDLERGAITPREAEGARIEISRRLLSAARRARTSDALKPAPQGHSGMAAGVALIGAPALAAAVYLGVGAPGEPDRPLREGRSLAAVLLELSESPGRPGQAEAEARAESAAPGPGEEIDSDYLILVDRLERTVAERPNDQRGHRHLGNAYMQLGRWADAATVYARAVEIDAAGADADLLASLAEALVLAAGGYVSPAAERALAEALSRDRTLEVARYYAGLALRQAGRLDAAIGVWRRLRADSPPGAPRTQWLDMLLAETARVGRGGDPPRSGPTQAEIDAAREMSPGDRQAMIKGMVARLEDRLKTEGGTPQEWMQLIASYVTLDRAEAALAAYEQALIAYPGGPAGAALRDRAAALGIRDPGGIGAPGPTQAEIEAAREMSPEDRGAMIEGMVARLEDRLTAEGGTAEEWLRLIASYARLDRMEDANRVYDLAEAALADDPGRGFVKEQALLLGVHVE